uniref:Rrp44-like cold shock domain-containing protein n=1 Tax=Ciona savignyi TaxID=51511 RepID=H2Z1C7_CIOSA
MYSRFRCIVSNTLKMNSSSALITSPNAQSSSNQSTHKRRPRHRNHKSENQRDFQKGEFKQHHTWPSGEHCVVQFFHLPSQKLNIQNLTQDMGTVNNSTVITTGNRQITKIEMKNSEEAEALWKKYQKQPISGVTTSPDNFKKLKSKSWKPYFDDYLSPEEIEQGIANGQLIKGALRINAKKFTHAFITDTEGHDILIDGFKDRNRALQGDVVALRIKDKKHWIMGASDLSQELGNMSVENSNSENGLSPNVNSPSAHKF